AAQELANRGSQDGAAVAASRIRRWAGPLELQFDADAVWALELAEYDGTPITELSCPIAELMTTVVGRVRRHSRPQRIAGENARRLRVLHAFLAQAEFLRQWSRPRQHFRGGDGGRLHPRPEGTQDFARMRCGVRISG